MKKNYTSILKDSVSGVIEDDFVEGFKKVWYIFLILICFPIEIFEDVTGIRIIKYEGEE